MYDYKQKVKVFFSMILLLCVIVIGAMYVYDPLQIYHKPWLIKKSSFVKEMRLQDAGIINNYNFDSVLLGTSMLDTTSEKEATIKLKSNFVNLSIPGGDLYERGVIMRYLLKKKKVKNIIYSLDTGWDLNLQRYNKRYPLKNFSFLYDKNPLNDLKVYWNDKYIQCLLKFSSSEQCIGRERTLQRDNNWFIGTARLHENRTGVEQWIKMGKSKNIYNHIRRRLEKPLKAGKAYEKRLTRTYKIINKNLLTYVKRNRRTQFHIIFPPYSRFLFAVWRQKDYQKYKLYEETLRYLVESSFKYKNLKVYAFDDLDYLNNLNHYKDSRHFAPDMGSVFLDAIQQHKYFKTIEELEQFITKIDKKNNKYPIDDIIDTLKDAHNIIVTIEKKKISTNGVEVKGWIMANSVTSVELRRGKEKFGPKKLIKNKVIYDKYPQYKLMKNSFTFDVNFEDSNNKKIILIFRSKKRIIKKVYLTQKKALNEK